MIKPKNFPFPHLFGKLSEFCELHFWICLLRIGRLPISQFWTLGVLGRSCIPTAASVGMVLDWSESWKALSRGGSVTAVPIDAGEV